ncbi:TetR/AcrR family transcriptional regulator [Rhodococcus sp. NPDC056960]|uniref:TetR/AcrR family transcriptional regulator n=1 Tax=Rhodococcus sp. NPDC056960 TaxID=3345982 RepID=UPI0036400A27
MLGEPIRDRLAERREATRREIVDAAWELARDKGLADWTLRDVARRVGMQAPSLYSHFASKNAIFDAMFGQAWLEYESVELQSWQGLPAAPRKRVLATAMMFFDFAAADLARYQLMNQRSVPGFEPSPESFAPSVRVVERAADDLASLGITDRGDVEILFALIGGLVDQQHANDPGGHSRRALLARAIGMWSDGVGLAAEES